MLIIFGHNEKIVQKRKDHAGSFQSFILKFSYGHSSVTSNPSSHLHFLNFIYLISKYIEFLLCQALYWGFTHEQELKDVQSRQRGSNYKREFWLRDQITKLVKIVAE